MSPIIRNILAVALGILVGGAVNMGIVAMSGSIIPPPEGVDTTNIESIKASMHLYESKHFIMPFLAHALGTLAGAFVAALVATSRKMKYALGIGVFFLLGGIAAATMLPSPMWFNASDLIMAYIPMGWLGGKLAISSARV